MGEEDARANGKNEFEEGSQDNLRFLLVKGRKKISRVRGLVD